MWQVGATSARWCANDPEKGTHVALTDRDRGLPASVAVVVCREGRLPAGAGEAAAEARGAILLAGSGTSTAAASVRGAAEVWYCHTTTAPARLAEILAPILSPTYLVLLPASPDGRDLAPRLSAQLRRPLLAGAVRAEVAGDPPHGVRVELLRADGQVVVPVDCDGPAVATIWPGARNPGPERTPPRTIWIDLPIGSQETADAETVALLEPDPATMDLSEAVRVLGGGAGLVPPGASDHQARAVFDLLSAVAAALGASAGATRVATDAGWMSYNRQIGTTGVTINPELYLAFGVSGASQHVGGLGAPAHTISVNTDPSCPMTAMANLGVVGDAGGILLNLAGRLAVAVPDEVREVLRDSHPVA
jgi:electron transfer flavoprotein alpha subunit